MRTLLWEGTLGRLASSHSKTASLGLGWVGSGRCALGPPWAWASVFLRPPHRSSWVGPFLHSMQRASAACWRRYVGTREIRDGQLFLASIEGRFKLLGTTGRDVDAVPAGVDSLDYLRVT